MLITKIADALNNAADRLERPNAWCKNDLAKSEDGASVDPDDPTACQGCSLGALRIHTEDRQVPYYATAALSRSIGTESIISWNDNPTRTQEEVVAAFRAAAKQVAA